LGCKGVKAPDFLKNISGLSTNPLNQIVVSPSLQSVDDETIFAMGDCATCFWENDSSGRKKMYHQEHRRLINKQRIYIKILSELS
jgi:NADH dehydrogenase FAD-containing subunit